MFLEKTYLPIINFIYERTKWISDGARKAILIVSIIVEVLSTYIYQCDVFMGFVCSAVLNSFVGIICFTGIIIAGIDHKIDEIKVRKWPVYILMICGIVIFISGFHHFITYSYMIMGIFMFTMMPVFIIAWSDRKDIELMFRGMAWVLTIYFAVFIVLNVVLAPINNPEYADSGRYFGMAADPNGLAKVAVTASIAAIYLMIIHKGILRYINIPIVLVAVYYIVASASRTNLIALILIASTLVIFAIKVSMIKYEGSNKLMKWISVGAGTLLMLMLCISFINRDGLSEITIIERLSQGIMEDGHIDMNRLSSGRLPIWEYCVSKASIIGHDISNGIGLGEIQTEIDHVHNTVIEILHRSGIVAGVSFLVIELYCIVWAIKESFGKKINGGVELIIVMLLIAFVMASIFDIVVLPFAKMTTFLFYLSMPIVFSKRLVDKND